MGLVYLASDPQIDRPVAIKLVRTEGAQLEDRREEIESRFLKEARIAGRLQHSNIVTIFDVGKEGESYFIAMEFVDGRPLSRLLRSDVPLNDAQKFGIARQVAEALSHAHERDVLHRDVKPANILIRSDGVVKVSDFGIGKIMAGEGSELTRTGQMLGSPSYMSPEQVRGDRLDPRSDLFSLGVVLYEMLAGERPFPAENLTTLVYQILHTEPKPLSQIRPDLSAEAQDLVHRCLAKKKEDRPANLRAFLKELSRLSPASPRDSLPTLVAFPLEAAPEREAEPRSLAAASDPATRPAAAVSSAPTVIVERRGGAAFLVALAALLLAASALIYVVRQTTASAPAAQRAPAPAPAKPAAPLALPSPEPARPLVTATSTPPPASASETAGAVPHPAIDASTVGRIVENPASRPKPVPESRRPASRPKSANPVPPATSEPVPAETAEPGAGGEEVVADNVYRTRHMMKFQISPDQARLFVDGHYIGIADDWDDHGGGLTYPFSRSGSHRVRATLPGYRDLNLQILVSPSADNETESAGDDLKKTAATPYAKIPKIDYATQGGILIGPDLAEAQISIDGRPAQPVTRYIGSSTLRLAGAMVHDILLTQDGKQPKALRIVVASTADKDNVLVKEKLK
jgi:serine/threonine-protein kinase